MNMRLRLIKKYVELPKPPILEDDFLNSIGNPTEGSNSWIDANLILAAKQNLVNFLITEDLGIHRKCSILGIQDRCLNIEQAISLLESRKISPPVAPPAVKACFAHELDFSDPIFDSLRQDYEGFNNWLKKCALEHRQCWIILVGDKPGYSGIAITNPENTDFPQLDSPSLKLCTFKVAEESKGFRFGELLLRALFDYANSNRFKSIFVEANIKHQVLIHMLAELGFNECGHKTGDTNELVLGKQLNPSSIDENSLTPLEFHKRFCPSHISWKSSKGFVVPIVPCFHSSLFPELDDQQLLLAGLDAFGNAIRKAYLCNTNTTLIEEGDILLFYRSRDQSAITTLGVVERTLRSRETRLIQTFMSNRTVYSKRDIDEKTARNSCLAILFYHAPLLREPISLTSLRSAGILNGTPQSITQISPSSLEWIKSRIQS